MASITALRLPIDWTLFGWSENPRLGDITLSSGDPGWEWKPAAPAFSVHITMADVGTEVPDFTVDHVVLLVPDLAIAVSTLDRVDLRPRLRMKVSGRPAAFFRVGTVLEVIEAPVRDASIYGIALAHSESLESLALTWKGLGLKVGTIKPAIQPGRRIMTVHDLDAGLAVMSADGATEAPRKRG
jgi:hypothetical protein